LAAINPLFLLSGVGMILVGLSTILYWAIKSRVSYKLFLVGGVTWVAAIMVKIAMDLTVSFYIDLLLMSLYSTLGLILVWGLILGLRSGFLECGFTYITASRLGEMKFSEAVAFGIGFGATEAIVIGFDGLINVMTFILDPTFLAALQPAEQAAVLQGFSNLAIIPAPIVERLFTLPVHIFSCLLLIYAIQARKSEYFIASFFYKSLLDVFVPWIRFSFNLADLQNLYLLDGLVMLFGSVGLIGSMLLAGKFHKIAEARPGMKSRSAFVLIILVVMGLFAFSLILRR
jgi:uncharacterized membrane protein YhfC